MAGEGTSHDMRGRMCSPECFAPTLAGTMQMDWGARASRPPFSASGRKPPRCANNHQTVTPPMAVRLAGGTPARATETVALPISTAWLRAS